MRYDCEKETFVAVVPEPKEVEWAVFLIDDPKTAKRVEAESFMRARKIGAWRFDLFAKQGWRDRDAPKVPDTSEVWAVRPRDGETARDAIERASGYLEAAKSRASAEPENETKRKGRRK